MAPVNTDDSVETGPVFQMDPRYEFCAPRFHDFSTSLGNESMSALDAEREQLEADEWFSKLNAGLIDTDLTSPRSRLGASSRGGGSSGRTDSNKGREKSFAKTEGLTAIFNNMESDEDEDNLYEESGDTSNGNHKENGVSEDSQVAHKAEAEVEEASAASPLKHHQEISKTSGTTATPSKNVEQILTVPVTESLVNEDANLSKKSTHNLSTSNTSMCLRSRRLLNGSAQRTLTNNRNTGGVAHANVDEDADAKCVSWPRKVPNRGQAFLASNSKSLGITIPQSPMLTTKVRASTRMLTRQTSSVVSKEQTLKRKIGKKPKSKPVRGLLDFSQSPAFHTRSRARLRSKSMGPKILAATLMNVNTTKKAASVNDRAMGAIRSSSRKIVKGKAAKKRRHTTSFEPFHLRTETRGSQKRQELSKIVENEEIKLKQLSSSFKARDVPHPFDLIHYGVSRGSGASAMGPAKMKSPTRPRPFNLRSQQLHKVAQKGIEKKRNEKVQLEKRMSTQFKARPSLCTKREPFKPVINHQNHKTLVDADPVKLKSATRASKRLAWNEKQKERRLKMEEEKALEEQQRKEREKNEVRKLRSTMEFKARPLPKYLR